MSQPDLDRFVHLFEPGAGASPVTLLALHGTGGDERDLLPLAQRLWPGASVLSPRGPVLENGMPRFFRRLAVGVFDQDDLRLRTEQLAAFVAAAADRYGFDPARVVAVGYSNGANIAASVLLSDPRALAGAVLLRAMVPFEPAVLPDLRGRRVLLSAGEHDPMVPRPSTERLIELLRTAGAEMTVAWHDTGHALLPQEIDAAGAWLARHFS